MRPAGPFERSLGWCVHGYTALGLVAAGLIAVLLVQGGPSSFRWCFLLMAAATIVDSTDGFLARKVRIKEVVPSFDGRRLDDLVDFLTYTFLPLLLIWRAGILPPGQEPWLFLPLLASAYGFCQVQAKTDDGYFLGFPSLWNVVALYLYMLPIGPWPSLAVVVVLAILTFVPTRHLYPSQPGRLNRIATLLGIPWTFLFVWLIWKLPRDDSRELRLEHHALGVDLAVLPACSTWASPGPSASPTGESDSSESLSRPSRLEGWSASSARASRWPSSTSTKNKSAPPTTKNAMIARIALRLDATSENRRPEDPREFLGDPEKTEEFARLVLGYQAGKERPAQSLRSPLHRPDQDGKHHEMGRGLHEVAENADRHVSDQAERDRSLGADPTGQHPEQKGTRNADELHDHDRGDHGRSDRSRSRCP